MKALRPAETLCCRERRGSRRLIGILIVCGLVVDLASAEIGTEVGVIKEVTTLSTQVHPKKAKLAYIVTESHRIGEVGLFYILDRWNFGPVLLSNGGKMIGTLEIIAADGTKKIRKKKKAKCEARIWGDESNSYNQRECWLVWEMEPALELEPGDVVLWAGKFKGMPNLEFESWEDTVYRDRYDLEGRLLPVFDGQ